MANLIITNYCNAECTFCFAADSRHRMIRNGSREMDETEFRDCLEFSMNGGNRELRLLGGEPTLHPFFTDFVKNNFHKHLLRVILKYYRGNLHHFDISIQSFSTEVSPPLK